MNWTDPISLSFLPSGKLVSFTAVAQAAYTQYVQVIDGTTGNPISFNDSNGNPQTFPVSGAGTGGELFGVGSFTMQNGYKIQFASSGSATPEYIQSKVANLNHGTTNFGKGTFFGTEDSPNGNPSSYDYNDTVLWLQSYEYAG